MKTTHLIIIILLVVILAMGGALVWFTQSKGSTEIITNLQLEPPLGFGSDTENATTQPPNTGEEIEILETAIKKALAEKYDKQTSEVRLDINEETSTHAQGLVRFADEISGGWWLAAKEEGKWVLVADGNGTVMCGDIEPYDFPTEIVSECYNQTTQQMITR